MGRAMCTTCLLLIIVSFASVGDTNGASIEATDATCSAADGKCHISTAATKNATAKEISLQEELELLEKKKAALHAKLKKKKGSNATKTEDLSPEEKKKKLAELKKMKEQEEKKKAEEEKKKEEERKAKSTWISPTPKKVGGSGKCSLSDLDSCSETEKKLLRARPALIGDGAANAQLVKTKTKANALMIKAMKNEEDCLVKFLLTESELKDKEIGTFVDIGAGDGVLESKTHKLETLRKWNGLCIEPREDPQEELSANRKCKPIQVAVGRKEGTRKFSSKSHKLSETGNTAVKVERLFNVLKRHGFESKMIDFLRVHTNGTEMDVLQSIDLSKAQIDTISLPPQEKIHPKLPKLLEGLGWHAVTTDEKKIEACPELKTLFRKHFWPTPLEWKDLVLNWLSPLPKSWQGQNGLDITVRLENFPTDENVRREMELLITSGRLKVHLFWDGNSIGVYPFRKERKNIEAPKKKKGKPSKAEKEKALVVKKLTEEPMYYYDYEVDLKLSNIKIHKGRHTLWARLINRDGGTPTGLENSTNFIVCETPGPAYLIMEGRIGGENCLIDDWLEEGEGQEMYSEHGSLSVEVERRARLKKEQDAHRQRIIAERELQKLKEEEEKRRCEAGEEEFCPKKIVIDDVPEEVEVINTEEVIQAEKREQALKQATETKDKLAKELEEAKKVAKETEDRMGKELAEAEKRMKEAEAAQKKAAKENAANKKAAADKAEAERKAKQEAEAQALAGVTEAADKAEPAETAEKEVPKKGKKGKKAEVAVDESSDQNHTQCPSLMKYNERLASFRGLVVDGVKMTWPHNVSNLLPEAMAAAGLRFEPTADKPDRVVCDVCGLDVYGWEDTDEPAAEHKKMSEDCSFFKESQTCSATTENHHAATEATTHKTAAQTEAELAAAKLLEEAESAKARLAEDRLKKDVEKAAEQYKAAMKKAAEEQAKAKAAEEKVKEELSKAETELKTAEAEHKIAKEKAELASKEAAKQKEREMATKKEKTEETADKPAETPAGPDKSATEEAKKEREMEQPKKGKKGKKDPKETLKAHFEGNDEEMKKAAAKSKEERDAAFEKSMADFAQQEEKAKKQQAEVTKKQEAEKDSKKDAEKQDAKNEEDKKNAKKEEVKKDSYKTPSKGAVKDKDGKVTPQLTSGKIEVGKAVAGGISKGEIQIKNQSTGLQAVEQKNCTDNLGLSPETPGYSCKDILARSCEEDPPNGFYWLNVTDTKEFGKPLNRWRVVQAKCDMEFNHGGWTRILVCSSDEDSPWNTFGEDDFLINRHAVQHLAGGAQQVHIRTYNRPDIFVVSIPGAAPIQLLRQGAPLNVPIHNDTDRLHGVESNWIGSMQHFMRWGKGTQEVNMKLTYPQVVYWAANNANGLHILNQPPPAASKMVKANLGVWQQNFMQTSKDKLCGWTLGEWHPIASVQRGSLATTARKRRKPHVVEDGRGMDAMEVFIK